MEKICCIISAGDVNLPLLKEKKSEYDFFIAADQGYEKAKNADIVPSVLIGDFDSLGQIPNTTDVTQILQYPIEKDYSDTHLALEEGIKLGYTHFHIYGALGGDRFSHSIANLQTLCTMKSKGISITLMGKKEQVYLLTNETLVLTPPPGSSFSIFSLSNISTEVTITGAKYPLKKATLTNSMPLGLSNQSTDTLLTVSVNKGHLLVILEL